jgi:tRNA-2-methylthio-N6-dimethylallyladenosine synthase
MVYHIITIGCQMNKSDSERIAGYLDSHGHKYSSDKFKADLVFVTTCGVRQSAEDRIYGLIPNIKKQNPKVKIILTGCLSQNKNVQERLKNQVDIWMPINELTELEKKLNKTKTPEINSEVLVRSNLVRAEDYHLLNNSIANANEMLKNNYLNIVPKYQSKFSAFVPIGNGCNNFCSYCFVPYARGREVYRPVQEILSEVKDLVKKGYKEITLIAQNVNSYQSMVHEIKSKKTLKDKSAPSAVNFAQLLDAINNIPGKFWIRFATSHPKDMSDELIKVISKGEKICEHVHLPAQAGDNAILKNMNRKYTREHYLKLIKKIKKIKLDGLPAAITTDIIVGFPGETKKQFNNTLKLFREAKFDMAYVAQFSPRPGTGAATMIDNVPCAEKKRREEALMKVLRKTALENNKKYIGQTVEVLIEGKSKKGDWTGKTRSGKKIEVSGKAVIGEFAEVKVLGAVEFGLSGAMNNE